MNSYELAKKYGFTFKEKSIFELAQIYMQFNRKRGDFRKYLPSKSDPRESKYWKYFENLYDITSKEPCFDFYLFLEAVYRNVEKDKVLLPQQLITKHAIRVYREHKKNKDEISVNTKTEKIMISLADTFKQLVRLWKKNNLSKWDYESIFAPKDGELLSDGMVLCIHGKISKYFMAVSKTFNKHYIKLDEDIKQEIITTDELKKYRLDIKLDREAASFAKEIFGDEVIV